MTDPDIGSVLLIEDSDEIADLIALYARRNGFALTRARTGEEGLKALAEVEPRVVLLDLGLPGIDGVEVARTIRASSDVPILIITARDSEMDTLLGLDAGADDYITKPFSPREVLARVQAVLRRVDGAGRGKAVLAVGDFTIDGGKREVITPDGATVRPTAREFDLVWYLAENAGLALSRAQILDAVWGYDYFGDTRTVDAHVRQLRRKLEGFPIETVWGVGYRVEP